MSTMEKGFVDYCCVAKGGKILQAYNGGDHEIENLAVLCLEKAPLYHRWYSQTMGGRTFFFMMEDGYVYLAIAKEGIENCDLLRFLVNVRTEFKKITKKGLSRKGGSSNANVNLQEQLVPVIRQLITSLQNVSQSGANGDGLNSSASPCDGYYGNVVEVATSTKAPLLGGKSSKQEKKVKDHHVIGMRGIELEEGCKSTERGIRGDLGSNCSGALSSPRALRKDLSASMRTRSQNTRRKWCRLVRLVLIIDAVVCVILFLVWLLICQGLQCVR